MDAVVNISDIEERVQGFRGQKNTKNRTPSGSWLGTELDYDNGRVCTYGLTACHASFWGH